MSPREDRRRRVLRDDAQPSTAMTQERKRRSPGERYTEAARYDALPRWVDLVPQRAIWICLYFTVGLASISAIGFASIGRTRYLSHLPTPVSESLDLAGYGTLARWWSTLSLMAAAMLAAVIYSIRCHRVDDYKGRYRQWALTAMLCVVASASLGAPLHQLAEGLAVHYTGYDFAGHPGLWWILPWALVVAVMGIRALLEMRGSKSACAMLCLALGGYLVSALESLNLLPIQQFELQLWLPLSLMLAHYALGWSFALYARYVYLDAQGAMPVAKRRARKQKRETSEATSGVPDDEALEPRKRKPKAKAAPEPAPKPADDLSEEELELLTNPELTRGERRKLKKKLKQQRRAA